MFAAPSTKPTTHATDNSTIGYPMTPAESREAWLNGWSRSGDTVLLGTAVHCAGCGKFNGVATVAFSEGWEPPGMNPAWPFDEADCPVHNSPSHVPTTAERVANRGPLP